MAYWLVRSRKEDPIATIRVRKLEKEEGHSEQTPREGEGKKTGFGKSILNKSTGLGFFRWRDEKGKVLNDTAAKMLDLDAGILSQP